MIYTGRDGQMQIDSSGNLIRLRDWTINAAIEPIEITDLGHEARKYYKGLKSATGSFTIFYHNDNQQVVGVLDNIINTTLPTTAAQEFKFLWGTGSTQKQIKFFAFITSCNLGMVVNDVLKAECQFQMTGDYQTVTL